MMKSILLRANDLKILGQSTSKPLQKKTIAGKKKNSKLRKKRSPPKRNTPKNNVMQL